MILIPDRVGAVRGLFTAETHDAVGRLVDRFVCRNAYTDSAALLHAQRIAGTAAPSLALSHIGLGTTGKTITAADTATVLQCVPLISVLRPPFRAGIRDNRGFIDSASPRSVVQITRSSPPGVHANPDAKTFSRNSNSGVPATLPSGPKF